MIGKDILATCIFGKMTEDIFCLTLQIPVLQEKCICFLAQKLIARSRDFMFTYLFIFIVWYHLEVTYFVGKEKKNQSLQWQGTPGTLITIQNISRANKNSQHAISWWYFSSSHILSELIQCSEEGCLCVKKRSSSLSEALAYCSGTCACEMHFMLHLLPKWDVKAVHTSFTFALFYGTA